MVNPMTDQPSYEHHFMTQFGWRLEEWRGRFEGRTVFVTGCGPSLLKQERYLEQLRTRNVLTCNSSWKWHGSPHAVVISDSRVLKREAPLLSNTRFPVFMAPSTLPCPQVNVDWFEAAMSLQGQFIPLRGAGTSTPLHGLPDVNSRGGCVVFTAIQVAAFTGAQRIVLLGVDMDYSGEQPHWNGNEMQHPAADVDWGVAKPAFIAHRKYLESRGVELVNATEGGRIGKKVLPRVSLADELEAS